MNWFFIGGYIDAKRMPHFIRLSRGNVDYSANVTQEKFIEGISELSNIPINVVSTPLIRTFPGYAKSPLVNAGATISDSTKKIDEVGYINIEVVKIFSRTLGLIRHCKRMAVTNGDIVVAYSMHTPFLVALALLKKRFPGIITCVIVLDLPEFMRGSKRTNLLIKKLKWLDRRIMNRLLRYADSFVLVTKQMTEALQIGSKPYVVIEGIAPLPLAAEIKISDSLFTITYTGSLQRRFGLDLLLDAISQINDKRLRLRICGKGDMEPIIAEHCKKDPRIEWLGSLLPQEVLRLQASSSVLINPRQPTGEYTRYSFPSKLLEYMASGRPALAYRLEGMPPEYDPYVLWIEKPGASGIEAAIGRVMLMSSFELAEFGLKAKHFVELYKTRKAQISKMKSMLDNIAIDRASKNSALTMHNRGDTKVEPR